jgi:hypothetical protein
LSDDEEVLSTAKDDRFLAKREHSGGKERKLTQ